MKPKIIKVGSIVRNSQGGWDINGWKFEWCVNSQEGYTVDELRGIIAAR